jgi:5'-phosphate synthase pdxT subunit
VSVIGVLALQGGFEAHGAALRSLGHGVRYVRTPADLDELEGLVLPGGESSVHLKLLARFGLEASLAAFVANGKPVLATCAGLILSARRVTPEQKSFGFLDVAVTRNAWGRQLDSFEARDDDERYPLVFIRAPRITHVGRDVEVLATLRGEPVLVREGRVIGATFHPELAGDARLHALAFGGRPDRRAVVEPSMCAP